MGVSDLDTLAPEFVDGFDNPLDGLAEILNDNQWPFDRPAENRMNFEVQSGQNSYRFSLTWDDVGVSMAVKCDLGVRLHEKCSSNIYSFLNRINAELPIGAFVVDDGRNLVLRYNTLFRGISASGADHVEAIVDMSVEACDTYYQSFCGYQNAGSVANDNPGHQMDLGLILARTIGNA